MEFTRPDPARHLVPVGAVAGDEDACGTIEGSADIEDQEAVVSRHDPTVPAPLTGPLPLARCDEVTAMQEPTGP